jgi:hypothetical protein
MRVPSSGERLASIKSVIVGSSSPPRALRTPGCACRLPGAPNPLGIDRRSARKVERPQAGLENRASGFVNHAFVQSVLTIGRQAADGVALRARKALLVGLGDRESLLPSCLRRCARLDLYSLDALRVFGRLLDVEVENAFVQVRLNGSLVRCLRVRL